MLKSIAEYYKKNPWLQVVILFLAWRLVIQIIVWWADIRFPDANYPYQVAVEGNRFLAYWAKWDSVYYYELIKSGYHAGSFFPLFPWIVKLTSLIIGKYYLLATSIVVNLAALGSCLLLYKIAKLEGDEKFAQRAVFYLLIFPASFFLIAHYTESLFLLFILLAFYFTFKKGWLSMGIFGFLASITRVTGILIFPALLAEITLDSWHKLKKNINWKAVLSLSLIPLGLGSLMVFTGLKFGQPLAFLSNQGNFGRYFEPNILLTIKNQCLLNLVNVDKFFTEGATNSLNYLLFFTIFLIFVILLIRYSRPSYAILGILFFVIPATSGTFISMNRFLLVLFPIYLLLAKLIKPDSLAEKIYTFSSLSLMILLTILFTNNYWVG